MDPTAGKDSLDLNLLFQNPGGGEEFVNVDDFFNTYVAELSRGAKRQAEQGVAQADPKMPRVGGPLTTMLPGALPQSTIPGAMQPYPSTTAPPFNTMQAPFNPVAAPMPGLGGLPPGMHPAQFMNAMQAAAQQQQQFAGTNMGDMSAMGINGKPGTKLKSSRQQESNKVAQQRYRERKKQKFHEMEETIAALQQQLAQLQALQQHNNMLEGMNTDLEKQLIAREREVERLKQALDAQADASLDPDYSNGGGASGSFIRQDSSAGAEGNNNTAEDGPTAATGGCTGCGPPGNLGDPTVCCDILPRDLTGVNFETGFSDQVEKLNAFLDEHSLRDTDPACSGLDKALMHELAQIVGRSCQLCQAAIRAEGVKVLDLIVKDPHELSTIESPDMLKTYEEALKAVKLRSEQQEQLLIIRKSHLEKMRGIYLERQALNMAAMGLMLPHTSRNPYEDNTLEGRMQNMSSGQYLPIAKCNAELSSVLDSIKDNLRQEQRAVMDLNCCLISRIMNPLQAALYMTSAYPLHCDALALANVLAQEMGRQHEGLTTNVSGDVGGGGQLPARSVNPVVSGNSGMLPP